MNHISIFSGRSSGRSRVQAAPEPPGAISRPQAYCEKISGKGLPWVLVLAGNAAARCPARIPAARKPARRLAGLALAGFGVRLALDRR